MRLLILSEGGIIIHVVRGVTRCAGPISTFELWGRLNNVLRRGVIIREDLSLWSDRAVDGGRSSAATGYVAPEWTSMLGKLSLEVPICDVWRSNVR